MKRIKSIKSIITIVLSTAMITIGMYIPQFAITINAEVTDNVKAYYEEASVALFIEVGEICQERLRFLKYS